MKALVVDDSLVMRKILIDMLGKIGIVDVGEAADGEEAVEAGISGNYDLVLMDWNMPKMSGYEALVAIRASGKDIPIIMVTTEAEKVRVIEAIKAGANSYIIKPFKPEVAALKIQAVLAKVKS
jgi:two-component system chemotaxis response regulator CheY